MTLTIGTWAIPALITLAVFVGAFREAVRADKEATGYGKAGAAAIGIIANLAAAVVALAAWLVWALVA